MDTEALLHNYNSHVSLRLYVWKIWNGYSHLYFT